MNLKLQFCILTCVRTAGEIEYCDVLYNDWGQSRGIGFVRYRTPQEALQAITSLDGSSMEGRPKGDQNLDSIIGSAMGLRRLETSTALLYGFNCKATPTNRLTQKHANYPTSAFADVRWNLLVLHRTLYHADPGGSFCTVPSCHERVLGHKNFLF